MESNSNDSIESIQLYPDLMQNVIDEISQFKSCKEYEQKTNHFFQFLLKFDYLLISSNYSKLKKDTIFELLNLIFENIEIALLSITSARETAIIISNINKFFSPNYSPNYIQNMSSNIKVGSYSIKMILKCCCNTYDQCPEIYKTFTPFLSALFSREDFFTKFAKSNIYEFVLSNILFSIPNHNYDIFIFDICFVFPKPSFFISIPMNSFITFFVTSINNNTVTDNSREITAKFVATLVSKVANVSKGSFQLFDQLGGFLAFDKLISNFPEKERPNYYSIFMVSDCEPQLIDHIFTLFKEGGNDEQTYFEMVSQKLRTQPELIQKCQTEKWFEMKNPDLNHLFSFFKFIYQNNQQLSASSLPYLIKSFLKIEINFNVADDLLKITQKLISQDFLTLEQLSKMNFLDVFFFNTKQEAFLQLINIQNYLQIFVSIYFLSNENQQNSFFTKICENISKIEKEKFISICSILISKSPSIDNMKTLLNTLNQHKDCSYISILLNSFLNSDSIIDELFSEVYIDSSSETDNDADSNLNTYMSIDFIICQRNFILSNGIDWIFESDFLGIESIVSLISHLVSHQSYEQLEEKILSLDPEKHPLFAVDEESMLRMVYGLITKTAPIDLYYRPIRVKSLFIYLKEKPINLNPYNIFYLGIDFIERNLKNNDIYSVPYLRSFGNRCISPHHISMLFDRQENLIDLFDKSQDHFPFYMLFYDNLPLMFNISSSCFSFWIKIEQKDEEKSNMSLLFQADNGIKILSFKKKIRIVIETTKSNEIMADEIKTDFDATVWNHVFINVSSSYSFGSNFSISINSTVVSTKVKKKLNQISRIFFYNRNQNTISYVALSVRVFSNYQRNSSLISEIFSRGPSSSSSIENSTIASPSVKVSIKNDGLSVLTIKKKPIIKKKSENDKIMSNGIHSDIYLVPYLGFTKHPISQELLTEKIKKCESFELYEKLMKTYLLLSELNPNMLSKTDLIELMKNSVHKPSYELFIKILQRQINLFGSTKEILSEIIFDSQLWSIFDCVFIFRALFELFPISIWLSDKTFITFITHSILTNSDKPDLAQIVASHLVELPSLMKYVASLIKVAPVLSRLNPVWNQIEFRENSLTQEVLINSLIPVINKDNYNYFKTYLPFNEIKSLFIVSSDNLCSSIYALITQLSLVRMSMNKNENDYFEIDFVFLSKFIQLSHIKRVWDCAIEMNHLPSLLSLILSASIAFSYYYSNIDSYNRYQVSSQNNSTNEQNEKIEKLIKEDINDVMNSAINYCVDSSSKIMNDSMCLKIISVFYPYIFTYPSLFNNYQNLNDVSQTDPIVLNVNQFSDIDDDLWVEKLYILSRFNFPPSQNPLSYFSFTNQIVSSILRNYGFPMPFSFKSYDHLLQTPNSSSNKNLLDLISWFTQSSLLDLMFSIISNCSVQFLDSFLYSTVSSDHNNSLLSTLVHGLLIRTPTNSIEKVLIILDFVSVLSSFQLLNQNAIILMSDLFAVFNMVQTKFGYKEASVVASRIQPVLISLLNSIPFSEIKMLFSLLSNNVKSFSFFIESTKSLHSWLYSFIAFSLNEIEVYNEFINKVKSITQFNEKDLSIMEKISKRTIQRNVEELKEIESEWKELTNNFRLFAQSQLHKIQDEKNRLSKEFNQISIDFNYFRYYTNVKHFLLSFFVCQNIRYFEVSSSLYKEYFEWQSLMRRIRKDLFQFKPKYRLKYNFSWPYQEKRSESKSIMIQSVFNDLIIEKKKVQTIKSEVIKTFKEIIKFQYVFINDIPLNSFNLFKETYGIPDSFSNSKMILGKYEIPCVLMLYDKKIMILTYAIVQQNPGKTINSGSSMSIPMQSLTISGENNFIFQKEKDTFELNCFYQNVLSGNFGPVDLFASHVMIYFNLDSLISIQWIDKLRFKLWSIINGFFEFELSQKVNIKYKDTFPFNAAPTKEEIYQEWIHRQISTNDMFDQLNQQVNCKDPPFYKEKYDETEEEYNEIKNQLTRYFNENFFQKGNISIKRDKEIPLFYAPFSTQVNFITRSSLTNLYSPFLRSIYFRGRNTIYISSKKIICSCIFFVVQIDLIKSNLTIRGHPIENQTNNSKMKTTTLFIKKNSSKFKYATHLSVSSNGVFISIDYSYGVTEIYRIKSKKNRTYSSYITTSIPYQIKKVIQFSNETLYYSINKTETGKEIYKENELFSSNYSITSDQDMICITFYGRTIIMFNIINGFAINQINMPSEITAIDIDEFNSTIIVAMAQNGIQVINTSFISEKESSIDEHRISFSLFNKDVVTAMCVVENRNKELMRTVICGTESGKIFLVYYDDKGVDVRPLNSKHRKRIVNIEIDPEKSSFISIDAENIAFIWSKSKNEQFVIEVDN